MHGGKFSWRFAVLFFLSTSMLTGCGGVRVGCLVLGGGQSAEKGPETSTFKSLGEQVWELLRDNAAESDTNAAEKVAVWEQNKSKFIEAFDTFLPPQDAQLLSKTAGEVFKYVDNGTVPQMTHALASMLELLYTNPEDPEKRALKGLHAMLKPQDATLDPDVFLEFLGRLLAHKELQDFIAAIGDVIRWNDGVDENGMANGEQDLLTDLFQALSDQLEEANVQNSNAGDFQGVIQHMLATRDLPSSIDLGEPAWVVDLENNNPVVAVDPNTGNLYEPFIDLDLDGIADCNADGKHVDVNGDLIDIPAFGTEGFRDLYKRALSTEGGDPIYVYFDAKRTALAGLLMFAGDLLEKDVPRKLRPVAKAILGDKVISDNGTPGDPSDDFTHYPSENNPLLDLMWSVLELTRSHEVSNLTGNMGGVDLSERRIAERLVLYTGKILKAFQEEDFLKEYDSWIKLLNMVDNLLPILDEIFEKPNTTSQSTGEILMQVMKDLSESESENDVDNQFGLMIQYKNLVYDDTPNGKVLNTTESIEVDFDSPMDIENKENLSVVEQTVLLVTSLDGPNLPLMSSNLADVALNAMANGAGNSGLVDFLIGMMNIPGGQGALILFLNILGYDGEEVLENMQVLDDITASGSTEGFSTVLKVFKDQDQMDLVKDIFHILNDDLHRDADNDPDTYSMIRKSEKPLSEIFQSTIMNDITTLLDAMQEANQINNGTNSTNNFAEISDAIAYLIDDDVSLTHRDGTPAQSRIHWLTRPLRTMLLRIDTAGEFENLTGTVKDVLNMIAESTWNDNGTPSDTTDDFEELARPALAAVVKAMNSYSGQGSTSQTQQEIDDFVDEQQLNLLNKLTGKALPSAITLWESIDASESSEGFYTAIRNILRPHADAIYKDVFASLMTILGQMLENGIENEYETDLNAYLAHILDEHNGYIIDVTLGLEAIATAGIELSVLDLLKNLLWKGEDGTLESPAEVILDIFRELQEIGVESGTENTFTVEDLEKTLEDLVWFARDDVQGGLPGFYNIIKNRNQ